VTYACDVCQNALELVLSINWSKDITIENNEKWY